MIKILNKLTIFVVILMGVLLIQHRGLAPAENRQPAAKTVPTTYASDTRSVAEWVDECQPVEARQTSSGVISYWCSAGHNHFDDGYRLPAPGWERIY